MLFAGLCLPIFGIGLRRLFCGHEVEDVSLAATADDAEALDRLHAKLRPAQLMHEATALRQRM